MKFTVVLIDEAGNCETAYLSENRWEAVVWVREWLREPVGISVAIVPEGCKLPGQLEPGEVVASKSD